MQLQPSRMPIHARRNPLQRIATALIAKQPLRLLPLVIAVNGITRPTTRHPRLETTDPHPVHRKQFQIHLKYDVLHRKIGGGARGTLGDGRSRVLSRRVRPFVAVAMMVGIGREVEGSGGLHGANVVGGGDPSFAVVVGGGHFGGEVGGGGGGSGGSEDAGFVSVGGVVGAFLFGGIQGTFGGWRRGGGFVLFVFPLLLHRHRGSVGAHDILILSE
mmetsp:Transcript_18961/g.41300  ORF Transcript_18961/g.41300 Transcript_18961/m.41300 type:complete len:216 (+) Transcript_18961:623-1270(+)